MKISMDAFGSRHGGHSNELRKKKWPEGAEDVGEISHRLGQSVGRFLRSLGISAYLCPGEEKSIV